ncbi:MAG: 8-hydroxy-5-deazaflavin:NADPH oxidoreductase [Candidatus Lokiarchaeum sp. GC14_75]|nr:MAG: 8-hydroxy-5-deazaflavin:NADPH oxidoreductase [Candidatus Lokiarchaeum sp. GC14_75]
MKIGIIGTGNMGKGLGKIWAEKNHQIMFGSRDPVNAQKLANSFEKNVLGGTYADAAQYGEVVVLAVPWSAAQESIQVVGDLNKKIVIDCTNAVAPQLGGLLLGHTTSAAEKIAEWAKGAKIVKAFNSLGAENLTKLQFGSQNASTFICGDDLEAKSIVSKLGEDIGFDVIDAGPLKNARLIEPLAMLWIDLAFNRGMGTDIAFKLLRRRKAK